MSRNAFFAVALVLVGCGKGQEPVTPAAPPSSGPTASAELAAAPPAPPAPAEEPAPKRKPFEVHSTCAEVVTVSFADDPKAATAGRRTIAPSASVEGPRKDDGSQMVWLIDDKGEPIAKVQVTRGMKRVEIGRSCRTLDAR